MNKAVWSKIAVIVELVKEIICEKFICKTFLERLQPIIPFCLKSDFKFVFLNYNLWHSALIYILFKSIFFIDVSLLFNLVSSGYCFKSQSQVKQFHTKEINLEKKLADFILYIELLKLFYYLIIFFDSQQIYSIRQKYWLEQSTGQLLR
jgi:hypothetical protein